MCVDVLRDVPEQRWLLKLQGTTAFLKLGDNPAHIFFAPWQDKYWIATLFGHWTVTTHEHG